MRISALPAKWPFVLVVVLGVFSSFLPASLAGLMNTNLALNDTFGPDAGRWHGSVTIDVNPVPMLGHEVEAVVEWAVFAPVNLGVGVHKFQQYLNANHPGATIPAGSNDELIYAYEVVSVAKAVPGIATLSVAVDVGDARGDVGPTSVPLTGGQAPSGSADQGTSMLWLFLPPPNTNLLSAGEKSEILVFSSPFAPELDFLQLSSGVASPQPSPLVASISDRIFQFDIPEPMSAVLFVFGAAAMLIIARQRR